MPHISSANKIQLNNIRTGLARATAITSEDIESLLKILSEHPEEMTVPDVAWISGYCQYLLTSKDTPSPYLSVPLAHACAYAEFQPDNSPPLLKQFLEKHLVTLGEMIRNPLCLYALSKPDQPVQRKDRIGIVCHVFQSIAEHLSEGKADEIVFNKLAQNWLASDQTQQQIIQSALDKVSSMGGTFFKELLEPAIAKTKEKARSSPPSTPSKSSESAQEPESLQEAVTSTIYARKLIANVQSTLKTNPIYFISLCQQLSNPNHPINATDLLHLAVALSQQPSHDIKNPSKLDEAFSQLLESNKEVVKQLMKDSELLYWLSIQNKKGATVSKALRVGKVLNAYLPSESITEDMQALATHLAMHPHRDVFHPVIQSMLKDYKSSMLTPTIVRKMGANIGVGKAPIIGVESLKAELKTALQEQGYEPESKQWFSRKTFTAAAKSLVVNTERAFNEGMELFKQDALSNENRINIAHKFNIAFSNVTSQDFTQRQQTLLMALKGEDQKFSLRKLESLSSVLIHSDNEIFWQATSFSDAQTKDKFPIRVRAQLITFLLKHLKSGTLSKKIQNQLLTFIINQVNLIKEKDPQLKSVLPVIFNQEIFNTLKTLQERSISRTIKTTLIPQLFTTCFSAELHDALYAAKREEDWRKIALIVTKEEWIQPIPTEATVITQANAPDTTENLNSLQIRQKEDQWEKDNKTVLEQGGWTAIALRFNRAYPKAEGSWFGTNFWRILGTYVSGGTGPQPIFKKPETFIINLEEPPKHAQPLKSTATCFSSLRNKGYSKVASQEDEDVFEATENFSSQKSMVKPPATTVAIAKTSSNVDERYTRAIQSKTRGKELREYYQELYKTENSSARLELISKLKPKDYANIFKSFVGLSAIDKQNQQDWKASYQQFIADAESQGYTLKNDQESTITVHSAISAR